MDIKLASMLFEKIRLGVEKNNVLTEDNKNMLTEFRRVGVYNYLKSRNMEAMAKIESMEKA